MTPSVTFSLRPQPRQAFDVVMLKPEPCRGKEKRPFPKGEPRPFVLARHSATGLGRTLIKAPIGGVS